MKTQTKAVRWDDIVFENRNKDYGAYDLRQDYHGRLMTGLIGSSVVALILLFLPALTGGRVASPVDAMEKIGTVNLTDIPIPKLQQPEQPKQKPQTAKPKASSFVVTSEPVETDTEALDELLDLTVTAPDGEGEVTVVTETVVAEPPVEVNKIHDIVEVMPSYTGGMEAMIKYITKNMKYPASAKRLGIEGSVYVQFVVGADGKVTDAKVLRGIHSDCDAEAVRVISSLPGWVSGKQNGKAVSVRMVLPIKFRMSS